MSRKTENKVPRFLSESEEAAWWDSRSKELADAFEAGAKQGSLGHSTVKKQGSTPATTIRLDQNDLQRARVQARSRGLRYQTYIKMLLHEALNREEKRRS